MLFLDHSMQQRAYVKAAPNAIHYDTTDGVGYHGVGYHGVGYDGVGYDGVGYYEVGYDGVGYRWTRH